MTFTRRDFLQALTAAMPIGMAAADAFCEALLNSAHGTGEPDDLLPDGSNDQADRMGKAAGRNFFYGPALREIAGGELNLATANLRLLAVMTKSSAGRQARTGSLRDFNQLDEFDGAGYSRLALANVTDEGAGALGCDDLTWLALAAGSRSILGFLIFRQAQNPADRLPVIWLGGAFHPFTPTGGQVTIAFPSRGFVCISPELLACGNDWGEGEVAL